ncbi:MAG: ABC transporter permease [Halobacteriota archaeon]
MSTQTQRRWIDVVPEPLLKNRKLIFIESVLLLSILWTVLSVGLDLADVLSSPILVAGEMYTLLVSGQWQEHFVATMRRIMYGFLLTVLIGTALGLIMGLSDFWKHALQDYVTIGLALPSLFAAVFAAMWFGVSDVTPMVAGAAIAFPFLAQNVYQGVKNIDYQLLEMSSSFGVKQRRVVWRVIVQGVLPEWFAGLRYAFAVCWKITTLAELVAANSGIGFMIEFEMNKLSLTGVITWTLLFTFVILFVEYGILQQIEKRVFDWREETSIGIVG